MKPLQYIQLVLRRAGLGIIGAVRGSEPRKVLVLGQTLLARLLAVSIVHILPVSLTIILVFFNFYNGGRFIGRELQGRPNEDDLKLGGLQVAAKVQASTLFTSTHWSSICG
jgi:hypothetical protein